MDRLEDLRGDRTVDRLEDLREDPTEGRSVDRLEGRSVDRLEGRSVDRTEGRSVDRTEDRSEDCSVALWEGLAVPTVEAKEGLLPSQHQEREAKPVLLPRAVQQGVA